jgi:hypothetical protein
VRRRIPIAVAAIRMKGTMKETRQATCGVKPLLWTRESNIAGIAKLAELSNGSNVCVEED